MIETRALCGLSFAAAAALLTTAVHAQPAPPRQVETYEAPPEVPFTPEEIARREASKRTSIRFSAFAAALSPRMRKAGFSGEIAIAYMPDRVRASVDRAIPKTFTTAQNAEGIPRKTGQVWRWASLSKQVIAVLVMQEVARGTIDLDQPLARYLPGFASPGAARISVRQLLRHQTGLPNPDDTPANAEGVPSYYTPGYQGSRDPVTGYCAGPLKGEPGGAWSYNNCDYIVAGALLEAVTGQSWQALVAERLPRAFDPKGGTAAKANLNGLEGFTGMPPAVEAWLGHVDGKPEPLYDIASFGAAAGLYGTALDAVRFETYLAAGRFLPSTAIAEMWDGRPELGYLALGQWAFEAQLKGCEAPVHVIERRGAIGGVQVRNLILPESRMAIAMFTDQAEFDFGEIWQGAGFSYEMLSLAACPQGKA